MAQSQTKATAKYQKKAGIIAKSYKIKKDLAEDFKKPVSVQEFLSQKQ